jgi:hypothetical protein
MIGKAFAGTPRNVQSWKKDACMILANGQIKPKSYL